MYNTFENLLNSVDWVSDAYMFARPTLDNKPYRIIVNKERDKSTIVFNALGIKKSDIKVDIIREGRSNYLTISGETKCEILDRAYSTNGRFLVDIDSIDHIDWDAKDGLITIEVFFKVPEKVTVKINSKK